MRAKVINGFYSFEKGRIIEKNETIEVGEERGRELIALGLIAEAPEEKTEEKPAEPEEKTEEKLAEPEEKTEKKAKK